MALTRKQHDVLLLPIKPHRVRVKDGMSNVEAYDIRAHLTRLFGFAQWSEDVLDVTMLYEQSKEDAGQTRWRAAYQARVRLTIHATGATYTESAVGTNFGWLPDSKRDETHDMAIKTAASQALKRCAINLGDQFGLSLYNKGSLAALVGTSLVIPDTNPYNLAPDPAAPAVDAHITEPLAPETPAPQDETPQPAPAGRDTDSFRTRALEATTKPKLARLLLEATTAGVAGSTTTDADGAEVVLADLINARIKKVA